MYVETVPNRNSRPTILLREGKREGSRVVKKTLLNITDWPTSKVEGLKRVLRGETVVSVDELFRVIRSTPHGHVEVVRGMIEQLGLDTMIASKRCRERDLVIAMIAERLIYPCSKLATTRHWHSTTLAEELGVADADVDEVYDALDWVLTRQKRIETKLAKRHVKEHGVVLYDVSSSYYEGHTCPLAVFGHDRDNKKGKPIIVYGVMTDQEGRPIAVDVYPGNTGDPSTVADQVEKMRTRFGLERIVLVGDRGMLTQTKIEMLKKHPGLGWISALRSGAIRTLVEAGDIQLTLFDQQNLAEITSPEFPGERLIVCCNPLLAEQRREKRRALIEATKERLDKIVREVARRTTTPLTKDQIALKAGKVINRYKVGKHFILTIEDNRFEWKLHEKKIAQEQALDGIYVIRTSESKDTFSPEQTVRTYKNLAKVERAFRTLKGIDIRIRPIRHFTPDHVRAHIFVCLLAYYVEWHMRKALAPVLFDDEELDEHHKTRDPVAPAKPSASAQRKKLVRNTPDGLPIHSFDTLLEDLGTRCRNVCVTTVGELRQNVYQHTDLSPLHKKVFELLNLFPVR